MHALRIGSALHDEITQPFRDDDDRVGAAVDFILERLSGTVQRKLHISLLLYAQRSIDLEDVRDSVAMSEVDAAAAEQRVHLRTEHLAARQR